MEGKTWSIFYEHNKHKNDKHTKADPKNTMLIKNECSVKKKLENKYVYRRKIFLHEKHSDHNFLKKTDSLSIE